MIELTRQHAKAIKARYEEACKLNDVDAAIEFGKMRKRARELGYNDKQVTEIFGKAIDEIRIQTLE